MSPGSASGSGVTVVIPTYNRRELLAETLATVFDQEPRPHAVVVVDDGSTDGTAAMLEAEPVTVLRNEKGGWGPARARDEALAITGSAFVAFLDSDDLLLPGALATLERALRDTPAAPFAFAASLIARKRDIGWTATGLMSPDPGEIAKPLPALFARNFVPSVGSIARMSAVREIGGYPQRTDFGQDHYFWLRLAQLGDPVFVPRITSIYREHSGNRHSPVLAGEELEVYLALAAEDPRLEEAVPDRLGVVFCNSFTHSIGSGDRRGALAVLRRNLVARPRRRRIARRAVKHWRDRRRWADAGARAYAADPALRDWLGQH